MVKVISGNIFTSTADTLVNTVNCSGVMGAGIALEFKLRYPDMFIRYKELCDVGLIEVGKLWIYKASDRIVLNFPTKNHWKYPSKIEYLESGLQKFQDTYKSKEIKSIAFPLLGASNGGIDPEVSLDLMKHYLNQCDIDIEIYQFDPNAADDLFPKLKKKWKNYSLQEISKATGIKPNIVDKLNDGFNKETIRTMSGFMKIKGVGESTLEKLFSFLKTNDQATLF